MYAVAANTFEYGEVGVAVRLDEYNHGIG